jgi:rRNA-processing protein FCF1
MENKKKLPKFTIKNANVDLEKVNFEDVLNYVNPIIFDTNFLFITFEFRIDIIGEIERLIGKSYNLFIYEGTIDELYNIELKKDKNKKFLPLILTMLKRYNFKIIKSDKKYIDDQILENLNKNIIIATNDKELRKKIWQKGFRVMYMRQKSYLEIK